jgi:hypothetical protein
MGNHENAINLYSGIKGLIPTIRGSKGCEGHS